MRFWPTFDKLRCSSKSCHVRNLVSSTPNSLPTSSEKIEGPQPHTAKELPKTAHGSAERNRGQVPYCESSTQLGRNETLQADCNLYLRSHGIEHLTQYQGSDILGSCFPFGSAVAAPRRSFLPSGAIRRRCIPVASYLAISIPSSQSWNSCHCTSFF